MKTATLVAAVAAIAVSVLAPGAAQAQVELRSSDNYFTLGLPAGWQATTPAAGTETILAAFENPKSEQYLAVTRVGYPNRAVSRHPSSFYAEVEEGLRKTTPGYKKLARKQRRFAHVRVLDLSFRHTPAGRDDEVIAIRFLFFRTFSLSLAVASKASRYRRQRRSTAALVSTFRPLLSK
jgi:hypothetical protein